MNVFVRTDASERIGMGHLMRCLALAQELRDSDATITFIMRNAPTSLTGMLEGEGIAVRYLGEGPNGRRTPQRNEHWLDVPWEVDASETESVMKDDGAVDWLVVDHYGIDNRWEDRVRGATNKLLVIDDLAQQRHACDLLLNQNLIANVSERYRPLVPEECRLLFGPKFALLRKEFRSARQSLAERGDDAKHLVIFLGGADPDGVTLRVLETLDAVRPSELVVSVVLGAANPHRVRIERLYADRERFRIVFHTRHMAQLMMEADLAIGAGGTSIWERCCLGLPAVVIAIADNQVEVSKNAAEAGACLYLGTSTNLSDKELAAGLETMITNSSLRGSMSKAGVGLVDGLGCRRVAKAMLHRPPRVRRARADDADRAFAWRNDEETRRYSLDPKVLSLDEHMEWFRLALEDHKRVLLIGEGDDGPIGVLRYDLDGSAATVSIYLDPARRGRGQGASLLAAGEEWLRQARPEVEKIHAEVLSDNVPSRHVFAAAGFCERSVSCEKSIRMLHKSTGRRP